MLISAKEVEQLARDYPFLMERMIEHFETCPECKPLFDKMLEHAVDTMKKGGEVNV